MREVSIILDGATKRMDREQLLMEVSAWQAARLVMIGHHNPKKFPEFSKVSSAKRRPKKRQSADQMRSSIMLLNQMFGGEVRKK